MRIMSKISAVLYPKATPAPLIVPKQLLSSPVKGDDVQLLERRVT